MLLNIYRVSSTASTSFDAPGFIAGLVAKSEISTLLHRYALLAKNSAPFGEMVKLFKVDDASRLQNDMAVRPAEMVEVVKGNEPKFIRHHITSIDIRFVSDTEAHAGSYYFVVTHVSSLNHWGSWQNVVGRDDNDGEWLIAGRKVSVGGGDLRGWFKFMYP